MSTNLDPPDLPEVLRAGLCAACRHARRIASPRRTYVKCGLASSDSRLEKYPVLPVASCVGFEADSEEREGGGRFTRS